MTLHPDYIVIHHSYTDPMASFDDIRKVHLERGMDDIAYHFLITFDGEILKGRPVDVIGAHAKGLNQKSLGVCCIGDFMTSKPPSVVISSLITLVKELTNQFHIPAERVIGHRDVITISPDTATPTVCPGDALYALLPEIRKSLSLP